MSAFGNCVTKLACQLPPTKLPFSSRPHNQSPRALRFNESAFLLRRQTLPNADEKWTPHVSPPPACRAPCAHKMALAERMVPMLGTPVGYPPLPFYFLRTPPFFSNTRRARHGQKGTARAQIKGARSAPPSYALRPLSAPASVRVTPKTISIWPTKYRPQTR
jgi:hypothetical protein